MLRISFGVRGNSERYRQDGWYASEERHTWTSGVESRLELPRPSRPGNYLLYMTLAPFVWKDKVPVQQLLVEVNGCSIGAFQVRETAGFECRVPWHLIETRETISVVFKHPNAARPSMVNGVGDERIIALAFEEISLARSLDEPPESPATEHVAVLGQQATSCFVANGQNEAAADIPLQELAMKFENLGENCEFGLVQRRCNAEPLGLLRFSSTPLRQLISALGCQFEGIGRPDLVEVRVSAGGREYMVLDKKFGFLYHPWVLLGEADAKEIHERECRRIPFLAAKLVDDLKAAEKIFVYKGMRPVAETEVRRLFMAMRKFGETTLLWVVLQDAENPAGTVKELTPGLLKGYVDRFAPGENAHDLSFDVWIGLCRSAYRLCRARSAGN